MRKRSLGRGLSQLLSGDVPPESRVILEIGVDDIRPNPRQPRERMDETELERLTLSIDEHGILQPIIVRRRGEGYELVAGERRWRAARLLAMPTVPCMVQDIDDRTALQMALVENLQREDLNEMEVAEGYRALVEEFGATQEEVAQHVGKSRPAVTNALRLLDLPSAVQQMVREGALAAGHARALLGLNKQPDAVCKLAEYVVSEQLSVRQAEELVRELTESGGDAEEERAKGLVTSGGASQRDPHLADAEERLQGLLATRVVIKPRSKGGGVIEIRYYDDDDLSRIVEELDAGGYKA